MINNIKIMIHKAITHEEKKLITAMDAVNDLAKREFETGELLEIYGEYRQQKGIVIALKSVYECCIMEEFDD